MKTLQKSTTQILKITNHIETNYPELYAVLDENPLTIPSEGNPAITIDLLEEYLDSLKQILNHYIKNHHSA
ncbi:hypothetical protein [uncultured Polaribacter sp.]|uniref:hypothetical protein n=1 Tax=uncultured Polaribacter sp. TaxID=174711 RepID=UPI0026123B59|nr:hypothetical protein [uncultured Polaribacter sp.]